MIILDVLSYLAWIVAALLLLWIVADAISISKQFDEELLTSSREGADDILEQMQHEGEDK